VSIRKPVLLGKLLHESSGNAGILTVDSTKYDDKVIEALDASVNLAIDGASSSASIKLAPGSNVNGRAYIEMFTIQGSAGVFRTRSPRIGYGNGNTTIQLEHAINQLGDFIITETYEKELTLEAAVKKIFSYYDAKGSSYWTYGGFDKPDDPDGVDAYNQKCVLSIDHDNCLDALQSVMEQYPYMYMKFDFSSFPWKVSIRNRPQLAEAQGRLSRNVKSATVTRDDTDLTTRAYGEYKNGKTYTYNAGKFYRDKYGIIEREISGDNDSDKALEQKVKTWVKRHKKPAYSVSIDGIELSGITGEKLDKLTVGKLMTLALPDYNTVITEQITGVSFPSVYKQPMSCTVTLNQEEEKIIKYIKKAQQSARRAGRSASRVQTAAIVGASVANNVLTLTKGDGTSVNFSKAVSLKTKKWGSGTFTVEGTQTNKNTSTGKNEEKTVLTATTKLYGIELQKGKSPSKSGTYNLYLPLKVTYATGDPKSPKADTGFTAGITVSAKTVYDAGEKYGWREANDALVMPAESTASATAKFVVPSSNLHQTAEYWYTVSADNSYAYIKNALTKTVARVSNPAYANGWREANDALVMPAESTASATAKFVVPSSNLHQTAEYWYTVSADNSYAYIKNALNKTVARVSNPAYANGWDAARGFVSPPDEGTSASMTVGIPASTVNQGSSYTFTVSADNSYAYIKNALNKTVARVSNPAYANGWDAARGFVSAPAEGTSSSMTVGIPASTVNQGSSYTFTVSVDNSYAYIKNAANKTVARVTNTAYGNGWDAAYDKVVIPGSNTTAKMTVKVPGSTSGTQSTYEYTVSVDNSYAYIKNAVNTTVARCSNTAYDNGKKAATVTLTHGSVTTDSNYQKHVKYTAANASNTSNKVELEFYLVKNGTKSQLRTGSASGTLIMEINNS